MFLLAITTTQAESMVQRLEQCRAGSVAMGHVTFALPLQETLGRVVESGLPALLLQCLYLFFIFPLEKDELLENDVQVQRMFVQVSERTAGLLWAETVLCFSVMLSFFLA